MIAVVRKPFAAALTPAAALVPARNVIPILGCVLLEAAVEGLFVTTSDLDMTMRAQVDGSARPPWSGCADVRRLESFVDGIPGDSEIVLRADDEDRLRVSAGRASCRLPLLPADEFPRLGPPHKGTVEIAFEAPAFLAALRGTAPAMDEGSVHRYMCGVFFGAAALCASDGHRMALRAIERYDHPEVIIPSAAVARLIALLRGVEGLLAVAVSPTRITFSKPDWTLASKLIDGRFPDYRLVLPERVSTPLMVDRAALRAAVALVASMYDNSSKARAVRLSASGGELVVATPGDATFGDCESAVALAGDGPAKPCSTAVNAKYLLSAIDSIAAETVELHLADDVMVPLWVCAAGEAHDGAVIVPMRV